MEEGRRGGKGRREGWDTIEEGRGELLKPKYLDGKCVKFTV